MKTIYLTGTAGDMQAERKAIEDVMPQLKEFLQQYGEDVQIAGLVDTSDDEIARKELKNCFRELKKGNVYFVSMLGDRYGNIPPKDVTEGFLEKVGIHADATVDGCSVMEIEVLYAALSVPDKTLVYFREPFTKKQIAGPSHKKFAASFGESRKVKKLKTAIKKKNALTIHEYKLDMEGGEPTEESADAFAHRVLEDLKVLIVDDMNKAAAANAEAEENTVDNAEVQPEEKAEDIKIPASNAVKGPINLNKVETPIWDKLKSGSKEVYNPESLRDEAVEISKSAAIIEQSDAEKSGDLYDEAMEIFRHLRKDAENKDAFDDTLDDTQKMLVTDEVIRDMGLTYFAYARIEFNAKNFDGAAAWGKQSIDSLTKYQQKYNKIETIIDLSNVWMLMGAALANGGAPVEAIDAVSAAISCFDGLAHNKNFKAPENFGERYKSLVQLAHTICINEKSGEAAKKWLKFCQQQSFQLSKIGDNAGMINYVNFSIAICEHQIYKQQNYENAQRYINMIHEMVQFFMKDKNKDMIDFLVNKGRNLLEVMPEDERVIDIVCSMLSMQANILFGELKHEEALKNYTEVVERRENYKDSSDPQKRIVIAADYARRASAYTELDRLEEAQKGYDDAIEILNDIKITGENEEKIMGEKASAYMNRSVCLGKQGKIEEAKESITQALELLEGKKLSQASLIIMRRRIRRMIAMTESKTPDAMYNPELMKTAKKEMDKLREANDYVKKEDYKKAAEIIEEALNSLEKMGVIDIVLPSEGFAANLAVCGSIYEDKLENESKAMELYNRAKNTIINMEQDGLRANPSIVDNLVKRIKKLNAKKTLETVKNDK